VNGSWKPKIERRQPAIEDYLISWGMPDPDIDATLARCQVDPALRGELPAARVTDTKKAGV
jgi:hypothetical protein